MFSTYRIKSRIKFTIFVMLCMIVTVITFNVIFGAIHATGMSDTPQTIEVTVYTGDTIWSLAEKFMPEIDRREAVKIIEDLNDLESPMINAGDSIKIPINQ